MGTGPTPRKCPTRLGIVMLQPSQSTLTVHRDDRHRCFVPQPSSASASQFRPPGPRSRGRWRAEPIPRLSRVQPTEHAIPSRALACPLPRESQWRACPPSGCQDTRSGDMMRCQCASRGFERHLDPDCPWELLAQGKGGPRSERLTSSPALSNRSSWKDQQLRVQV